MRIVLAGGGTGGHFYPLIAVSQAMQDLAIERTLIEPELIYIGPAPFDPVALQEHDIVYQPSPAGKLRRYTSALNFFDFFKSGFGIFRSTLLLYNLYPDVVFSSGGFAAFPTLVAARLLQIPVIIYDADAKPGRVSLWSGKFAQKIALAHMEAAAFFPEKIRDRIARTGHPIRKEIEKPAKEGGHEFLKLDPSIPTIFVVGGSQGARAINDVMIDALPELVKKYNVIHQAGAANFEEVKNVAKLILEKTPYSERYRAFGLLNTLAIRMAAGISSLIISRAGSGSIFEIASWEIPAILVPIPEDISHDQTENAFSYARAGGAMVIEQRNLTPHILVAEVDRLMEDKNKLSQMSAAARAYARPDAARKIATIIIDTALQHEEL